MIGEVAEWVRTDTSAVAINNESGHKLEFEMTSHADRAAEAGTDTWLLQQRYATVTAVGPILGIDGTLPEDISTMWSSMK